MSLFSGNPIEQTMLSLIISTLGRAKADRPVYMSYALSAREPLQLAAAKIPATP